MKNFSNLSDPVYLPSPSYSRYEQFWLNLIRDKRDLPFIHMLTGIHLLVVVPGIILFTPLFQGGLWFLILIPYLYFSQVYFKGRFGLMLHCMCHRKTFNPAYHWLDRYISWVVCPFFGHAPDGYFSHHIGMHHMENNMPEDTSSTMGYQRDSLRSFAQYFLHFLVGGVQETLDYLWVRRRKSMYRRLLWGEYLYLLICLTLCFINFKATLLILVLPLLVGRLVGMIGNWTQHAFVNPRDPDNPYNNSICCINTVYNSTCWNDGYHVIHHLRPGLHYTELPGAFLKQKEDLVKNKTLVFEGIHYLHIFRLLMNKRYDKLAENLVNLGDMFTCEQEALAVMKERTKKILV